MQAKMQKSNKINYQAMNYALRKLRNRPNKENTVISFMENTNNATVFAYLHDTSDIDDIQSLGANAIREAHNQFPDQNIVVELLYARWLNTQIKYFFEKWVMLVSKETYYAKTEKHNTNITIKGAQSKNLSSAIEWINKAIRLTTQSANIITPDYLEDFCKKELDKNHWLSVKIMKQKELEKENMWCFLWVNQWSRFEPRLITIEYNPTKSKKPPIALVGKWLTYDNWGMYMKPYPHANDMHGDMWWAATVLWIMRSLKEYGITKRVIWVVWIAENMVDANAYRNGDVLYSRSWKTVYVQHSDAEWRLVLADVLSYIGDTYNPSFTIDYATLTWACMRALGEHYTWVMWYNDKAIHRLINIGNTKTNDKARQLPLDKDCVDWLKHTVADLSNLANFDWLMWSSVAWAFLSQFVRNPQQRIHCDIAWTALRSKLKRSYDIQQWVWTWAMVHTTLEYLR